jgi:hypothetical protein
MDRSHDQRRPDVGGRFKPGSYEELHPGRFLKAGHLLGEPRTLTIASFEAEVMGIKKGQADIKGIIGFREIRLQYASQKTNHVLLQALFGSSPEALIGKRVTLCPAKDTFGRDVVDAVRVAGSPDMDREKIDVTVKYAEKCGRKPSIHTLTKTKMGNEQATEKPPGNITEALATIASWAGDLGPLKTGLQEKSWTKEERGLIKAALEGKG